MWWRDGSGMDDRRGRASAWYWRGDSWTVFRSYLGTGPMEEWEAELLSIGVTLPESVARGNVLRTHGVTTAVVFSDSQAAIRRITHLDPEPVQHLARAITKHSRAIHAHIVLAAGPGFEPDRTVRSGLLPGKQRYPAGLGTGWNRTAVPLYSISNCGSN
jgi:hypothetical protein